MPKIDGMKTILKQYDKKSTSKNKSKTVQFAERSLDHSGNSRPSGSIFNKNNRLNLKLSSVSNLSTTIFLKEKSSDLKKVLNPKISSSRRFEPSPLIMSQNQHVANYYPFNNGLAERIFVNSLRPNLKKTYAILMPPLRHPYKKSSNRC